MAILRGCRHGHGPIPRPARYFAKKIAGTQWNGYLFFGTQHSNEPRRSHAVDRAIGGPPSHLGEREVGEGDDVPRGGLGVLWPEAKRREQEENRRREDEARRLN